MANPDAPFGFRPFRAGNGGVPARVGRYTLTSAYSTAIYFGDLVKATTTGTGDYGEMSVVISTGNTDCIMGAFAGCQYTASDGSIVFKKNWVASTATQSGTPIYAFVWDDPDQLFVAQCDGTTVITDIGEWAGVVTTHTGSAITGTSAQEISTGQSTETTFKIVSLIGKGQQMPCRNAAGNQDVYSIGAQGLVVVRPQKHFHGMVATIEAG